MRQGRRDMWLNEVLETLKGIITQVARYVSFKFASDIVMPGRKLLKLPISY
jgi:hypothetical protein